MKMRSICDVTPMHAGHFLLGRPYRFDRRVMHDGDKNSYFFVMNNRKFVLAPLKHSKLMNIIC